LTHSLRLAKDHPVDMSDQTVSPPLIPVGDAQAIRQAVERFLGWLDREGYESYDPYDVWGTKYGLFSRRVYYSDNPLGIALVAPIVLLEAVCPSWRRLFVRKERFATADAQLVLAYLNLHPLEPQRGFLDRAEALAEEMLGYSVPGYSGYCWGYPFDWQHNEALWRKNTPYITCTPYCFEAYLGLFDATGTKRYFDIAESIAHFVHDDLNDTPTSPNAAAGSYSPIDHSRVINASAYRAFVLIEAAERSGEARYRETGLRNLQFILQSQNPDGSWLYALDNAKAAFIDHFHTCFVLKNLYKLNRILRSDEVSESIRRGYAYYRRHLFDSDDNPKPFAVKPRMQIVTVDLYNYAEAITLGTLLGGDDVGELAFASRLACKVKDHYQLPRGYFVTKVHFGRLHHTMPFLRWSQAQLFHSLTFLLRVGEPVTA